MADDNQPQQPAGDEKPAESAPETPAEPAAKPSGSKNEQAPPALPADKPVAAQPAPDAAPAAAKKPVAKRPPVKKKPLVMETIPWDDDLAKGIKEQFGDRVPELLEYREQKFLVATLEAAIPVIEYLKLEAGFDYLSDLTAVDYPKKEERFEVVYILYSFSRNIRVRVKTRVKDGEKLKSAVSVHLAANWLEREVYDMFGVEFDGHPDLKRILMPDDWEGFPLRKDSSIIGMDEQWVKENIGIDSAQ
jgi:NADH-quinone oxidoreductase subunit C